MAPRIPLSPVRRIQGREDATAAGSGWPAGVGMTRIFRCDALQNRRRCDLASCGWPGFGGGQLRHGAGVESGDRAHCSAVGAAWEVSPVRLLYLEAISGKSSGRVWSGRVFESHTGTGGGAGDVRGHNRKKRVSSSSRYKASRGRGGQVSGLCLLAGTEGDDPSGLHFRQGLPPCASPGPR